MAANTFTTFIPWNELKNPIYSQEGWSVKDACMIEKDGMFYLFFSAFYWEDGQERSHVVGVKSPDFRSWSEPLFNWRGKEDGWLGMCSPNIIFVQGTYYLTYNSWGDKPGQPNQLFYARSSDLEHWEHHLPLAQNLTGGTRAIDAAVIYAAPKYYLIWKEIQTAQIACCERMDGNWIRIGQSTDYWQENAHFIRMDGKYHLVLTARGQLTAIAPMLADGSQDEHWTQWGDFRVFDVPRESFNTHEAANAGFLADWRDKDGFFYLLYAGTTEGHSHARRGDNRLGLARSRDLLHWQAPPQ